MTIRIKHTATPLLAVLALALTGCVALPTGPSRAAMPGSGKDFDQFRADDAMCRQYALDSSGATPAQAQESSAVNSAAIGTVIGAAAGAALGGTGHSTAAGAGVGLLVGALSGSAAGNQSGYIAQRRYDDGYTQCMYSKGHRVAVRGGMANSRPPQSEPQPYYAPPPPSGSQQPPPPQAQVPYYTGPGPSGYNAPPPAYYNAPPPPGSAPPPPSAIVR